ncbi:MAG: replication factor C large subunit [Halobacteriales archaeon]|nr:replication factor C large subunit [Halobacteriales archaeon]
MADWTEKYRPKTLSEVRGNDSARDELKEWAETWTEHREAVIVHGSPGVGKTSAAHALAADLGWEVIELNASDQRTADDIERYAGRAARNTALGSGDGRQLIIVDEADNIHGNADRGGSQAVSNLVKDAGQPMVLIANEFYDMSRGLRNNCREIEFRDVSKRSILPVLRDICRKEGIDYEDAALEALAETNSGDLRSAINDLQAIAEETDVLTADDVVTGERDRSTDIFDFLDTLIKEADAETALQASYDVDETPDDLINWIEDNMPKDYAGRELADAYGFLARADRWLGRVRASQEYSYWRYASDNMTAGVAAARQESKGGWTRYGPPSFWSKLGRTRGSRETRDDVARAIAETSGVSMGAARREIMPFLAAMTHHCRNRELTVQMAATYELSAEHVSFLTGSGEDTNKVQGIVEDAQDRRTEATVDHSEGAFEGVASIEVDDEPEGESESGDRAEADPPDMTAPTAQAESSGGGAVDNETTADEDDENEDDSQSGLDDFV